MKKGSFNLNLARWREAEMGRTNDSMYDCDFCLSIGKKHSIIRVPGPPAPGNEVSMRGDPTTIRRCTGCGAEDGPWVPAPY